MRGREGETVSNHGSTLYPVKAPRWKCVFVNGAGSEEDVAVLSEPVVHFAPLRIFLLCER